MIGMPIVIIQSTKHQAGYYLLVDKHTVTKDSFTTNLMKGEDGLVISLI